jgi:hypothetical protein
VNLAALRGVVFHRLVSLLHFPDCVLNFLNILFVCQISFIGFFRSSHSSYITYAFYSISALEIEPLPVSTFFAPHPKANSQIHVQGVKGCRGFTISRVVYDDIF